MTITLASHEDLHNLHNLIETSQPTEADTLRAIITQRDAQLHGLQQANESLRFELAQTKEVLMEAGNELTKARAKADTPNPLEALIRSIVANELDTLLADTANTKSLLSAISTEHEDKIREIALEVMSEHTSEYDHDQYDNYDRTLDDLNREIEDKVSREDVPSERQISEMVSDAVSEFDIEDKVSDAIDNYDMSDKISDYMHDNDYLNKHDITRMLKEATITITPQ